MMRNHWITINCSSRETELATGPRSKQDDMTVKLFQDNKGSSEEVLTIDCFPIEEGKDVKLVTRIRDKKGEVIFYYETYR